MRDSEGRRIAIVIHGAFQSHGNIAGAALVLKDSGVKEVHMPDLAGHGAEKDIERSEQNLTERLAEELLSRREINQSLKGGIADSVTVIGHSLGASVALTVATQAMVHTKSLNLILVEPIFWLGSECEGQDHLSKNLDIHTPHNKTHIEITEYLRALLEGDKQQSNDFSLLTNLANLDKATITLIRGGVRTIQSKEEFKIETSEKVITYSVSGQEIGSLVPDNYCNRELFDNQLTIRDAGHNPFASSSFYRWLRLLIS